MEIRIKDPGSAITHFIALICAASCSAPLIYRAFISSGTQAAISAAIFIVSMIFLYAASTAYHTFDISEKVNKILKKIDHSMISVLIAGSYTPVCILVLKGKTGMTLLAVVWSIAIVGIIIKMCWIYCPKWFSSVLYIAMGWACVATMSQLIDALSPAAFGWLLAGGIFYTVGGVIYALKLKLFNSKHKYFGSHEIFHLFVMAGSLCHYIFVFFYVV